MLIQSDVYEYFRRYEKCGNTDNRQYHSEYGEQKDKYPSVLNFGRHACKDPERNASDKRKPQRGERDYPPIFEYRAQVIFQKFFHHFLNTSLKYSSRDLPDSALACSTDPPAIIFPF